MRKVNKLPMGKLIKLKIKHKNNKILEHLLSELEYIKTVFLDRELGDVFIIINGGEAGKCCTSNGVDIAKAKEMCRDFVRSAGEYVD